MWTYRQSTGELLHGDTLMGQGYAGKGSGKNNPAMQNVPNVGPLPQGWYTIGAPRDTTTHGPYVLRLTPAKENVMYGRSGFLVHGDSKAKPGSASNGCIILIPALRIQVWESGDHQLTVVEGNIIPSLPISTAPQPKGPANV